MRRPESAVVILLEIQQAIAQDSESMQHLARLVGHGAQILADDDHPIAHALQRENRKQRLKAIAHVGAFGGFHAIGNPVQAKEAHDMIDAQRSAVPAVLADGFGEQAVRRLRSWRSELGGGKPQSCPLGEKPSGGAPTRQPETKNSRWAHRSEPKRSVASARS